MGIIDTGYCHATDQRFFLFSASGVGGKGSGVTQEASSLLDSILHVSGDAAAWLHL